MLQSELVVKSRCYWPVCGLSSGISPSLAIAVLLVLSLLLLYLQLLLGGLLSLLGAVRRATALTVVSALLSGQSLGQHLIASQSVDDFILNSALIFQSHNLGFLFLDDLVLCVELPMAVVEVGSELLADVEGSSGIMTMNDWSAIVSATC